MQRDILMPASALIDMLRNHLIESGESMRAFARRADLSNVYVCHLVNGERENPSEEVLTKIAEALGYELVLRKVKKHANII